MNPDQESLLSSYHRDSTSVRFIGNNNNNNNNNYSYSSRWRKNLFLLILSLLFATCLTIYIYLNLVAINGNQYGSEQSRYKPLSRRKPMLDHESIFSDSGPSMIKLSHLLAHCIVALQIAGNEVVNLSLNKNDQIQHIGSKGKTLEGVDDVVTGADLKSHRTILNTIKDSYRRLNIVSEEDSTKEFENVRPEDDLLPIGRNEFALELQKNLHRIEGPHADRGSLIAQHETLVWIDPLDATKEYSENLTDYVTLMACIVYKATPIAGVIFKPFTNMTYWSMLDAPSGKYYHSPELEKTLGSGQREHSPDKNGQIRIIVSRSHAGGVKNLLGSVYGDRANVVSAGGSGYKTIELLSGSTDAYIHMTQIKKWDICAPHAILNSIPGGKLTDLDGNQIGFGDPKDKIVTRGLIATIDETIHRELVNSIKLNKSSN